MERQIKDEKNVNKYLNKNIIDAVKDAKQVKEDIKFLTLLQEKLEGQDKLDQNQIDELKELVSKQK